MSFFPPLPLGEGRGEGLRNSTRTLTLEQFLFGCSVSARSEPTGDVRCGDGAQAVAERIVEGHDGPRLRLSQIRLELREQLLDRVQVRAVRRQESHRRAGRLDG